MPRRPYLPPQLRTLRTEQIGASSHKNEYRGGVLLGNWQEERLPGPAVDTTAAASTYTSDFTSTKGLRPGMTGQSDVGRELLFGHQAKPAPQPPKVVESLQRKRREWEEEVDPDGSRMHSAKTVQDASLQATLRTAGGGSSIKTAGHTTMLRPGELPEVRKQRGFTYQHPGEDSTPGLRTHYEKRLTPLARLGA